MLHEGTFQLQTDLPLSSLQNLFQSWGKTLSMVLKLKLEGMTTEYMDSLPIIFKVCKIPKFLCQLTRKAD